MSELVEMKKGADGAWTAERIELIKKTICPKGIGTAEFELFIAQCTRSGLDPLLKECFCVPRRTNVGTRDAPNWVEKYEFQAAEAGMLRRAEEFPDFRGVMAAAVFSGDSIDIDAGAGTVRHHFTPGPKRGSLIGAWARLVRADRAPVVAWLDLTGYIQNTPLWGKIGPTMMEKCARVSVLRKGYPGPFGTAYIREEFDEEDTDERTVAPLSQQMAPTGQVPAQSRTEALKGQLRNKQLAAKTAKLEVEVPAAKEAVSAPAPTPPSQATVEATRTLFPKENRPWERIVALGAKYGKTPEVLGSIIRGATGKGSKASLNDDDVGRVEETLVAMAQMEAEPFGE